MSGSRRETEFLAEVTKTLIQAAEGGAKGGRRELATRLRRLADGCKALRYKRLYWVLDALSRRLSRPQPDMTGGPLEELGRLLADARYCCKAIKSLQAGSLTDPRLRHEIRGGGAPEGASGLLRDRSLITVGRQRSREGETLFLTTYLVDPMDGELYSIHERAALREGVLTEPFAALGFWPRIHEAAVRPSFPPRRIQLRSFEPGARNEIGLRDQLERHAFDSIGGLLAAFRTQREEYLAPRTLPVFFRPRALEGGMHGALRDAHDNLLPLMPQESARAQRAHLATRLVTPPKGSWGVFGRLVFTGGSFALWPFSLLRPDHDEPVVLL